MQGRIEEELALLRRYYPELTHVLTGQWVLIPQYAALSVGWVPSPIPVVFQIPTGFPSPGALPYGFYVPSGLRFQNSMPGNYTEPTGNRPPFDGAWGFFSWTPDEPWLPNLEDITAGSNLMHWVRGFANRFREGQ